MHREIVPQQELIEVFGPFPSDVAAAEHQYTFGSLDDAQGQLVPGDVFVPCGQPVLPPAELHEPVDLPGIETENVARFHRQSFGAYEDHVAQVDAYHRLQPVPFDMGQQHAGDILFDGGIPKKGRKAGHAGEAVDLHTGVRYECRYPGGLHPDMQEAEELAGHVLPVRVDRIKLVGGVGMGLLPARLVADKEAACAVLSEQPFQLPDVLICGCHGRLHFGGYGLSGPSGRFPGSLLKAGRLFLPLFFLRLEGTAFPQEFRTAFGRAHLDGGPVHLSVRGLELDGYLFSCGVVGVFLVAQRIVLYLARTACLVCRKEEHLVGHRVLGQVAGLRFPGAVVRDQVDEPARVAGTVQCLQHILLQFVSPVFLSDFRCLADEMQVELDRPVLVAEERELGIPFLTSQLGVHGDVIGYAGLPALQQLFHIARLFEHLRGKAVTLRLLPVDLPFVEEMVVVDAVVLGKLAADGLVLGVLGLLDFPGGLFHRGVSLHPVKGETCGVVVLVEEVLPEVGEEIPEAVHADELPLVPFVGLERLQLTVCRDALDAFRLLFLLVVSQQVTLFLSGVFAALSSGIYFLHDC